MAVESVTYINNYDPSLPSGGDSIAEGDDHLRNLKKGIKNTFPNVTGEVTATHTQLNDVSKIADIESSLENYNRDELGGAKYNSINGSEWVSGIVGSITNPGGNTFRVAFRQTLPDFQYVALVTPAAVGGKPIFGYVSTQTADYVDVQFSEWNGSAMVDATTVAFSMLIMDAHDA
jgi:hypothetical protein